MTIRPDDSHPMRILLLLVLAVLPLQAHNGAVAIAVPVEGIVVDGDLSDWPDNLIRYPLRRRALESV